MNCDPIARWYRLFEYLAFGRALENRRLEYLDQAACAGRVLILGDGDGRFTAALLKRNPNTPLDSIDISAGMLARAQQRLRALRIDASNLCYWKADARVINLAGNYDVIVTHFFLDCFTTDELQRLIPRIASHCSPHAKWLVSEFTLPGPWLRQQAARALIRFMYFFFHIATGLTVTQLPDYRGVMAKNGFHITRSHSALGGLLISELWEFYGS